MGAGGRPRSYLDLRLLDRGGFNHDPSYYFYEKLIFYGILMVRRLFFLYATLLLADPRLRGVFSIESLISGQEVIYSGGG
jgi:hypothetical protein